MQENKNKRIIDTIVSLVSTLAFTFYCFSLVLLHFNQTRYPETGLYESDLFAHISMALDGWGYSIMAIVFRLLSNLPTFGFYFSIAAILAAFEAFTIALTFIFLRQNDIEKKVALIASFVSGFVMPMCVKAIQPYRYIGYQSPSIWHNSTYIVMKFFALLCVILYLAISAKYKDEMKASKVIAFALLLALTTAVKTNFTLIFAPAALVFLIIDMILKVPFKRIFLCALTVIPSIAVILFQNIVLFGESSGNGIVIDPLYSVYLRAEKPYFTMVLSAAFPVAVLLFNFIPVIKDTLSDLKERNGKLKHRAFLFSWCMWFVGVSELLLLREVGNRALDDNFAWGYDFCLFLLFVVSIIYFVNNVKTLFEMIKENKKGEKGKTATIVISSMYLSVTLLMLIYHTFCGVYFFVRLSQGVSYFMYF